MEQTDLEQYEYPHKKSEAEMRLMCSRRLNVRGEIHVLRKIINLEWDRVFLKMKISTSNTVINHIMLYLDNIFQAFGHRELVLLVEDVDRVRLTSTNYTPVNGW